jgi:hypothetical protein
MTNDDTLEQACVALEAQGLTPSGHNLEKYFHAHGNRLSRRTAVAYLKRRPTPETTLAPTLAEALTHNCSEALSGEGPPPDLPQNSAGSGPPDPLAHAAAVVVQCQADLDEARAQMSQAVVAHALVRGILVDNTRLCLLAADDPAALVAVAMAQDATDAYRQAWTAYSNARAHLEQLERVYVRQSQEAWVRRTQPALVELVEHWREELRTATSDRMHAEAKKNLASALFTYHQAIASAPTGQNGHRVQETR